MLSSTIKVLSKFIPEAEFAFFSPTPTDSKLSRIYGIKIVPYRYSPLRCARSLLSRKVLKEFKTADIIIDIWGIMFADPLSGGLISRGMGGIHLLVGKLLGKPVIKYTADMGPFNKWWNRFFAKFYLNKIDLIFTRGKVTKKYLLELGITAPLYVFPDTAFVLEPAPIKNKIFSQEKIRKKPLIGISVSHMIVIQERNTDKYITLMAKISDYLIHRLDAYVILIPNEIFPNKYDDVYEAKRIYRKINEKDKVRLLMDEYPPSELKAIIGKCDLLIGARYHSIVAATSMCIPTLAIGWHHKYHQVMELMGQEDYVCDINSLNFTKLQEKIDSLWENREKIKAKMASKISFIQESVYSEGKIVKEMLDTVGR